MNEIIYYIKDKKLYEDKIVKSFIQTSFIDNNEDIIYLGENGFTFSNENKSIWNFSKDIIKDKLIKILYEDIFSLETEINNKQKTIEKIKNQIYKLKNIN